MILLIKWLRWKSDFTELSILLDKISELNWTNDFATRKFGLNEQNKVKKKHKDSANKRIDILIELLEKWNKIGRSRIMNEIFFELNEHSAI